MASPAEELPFADNSFDTVTACQCFFYFDRKRVYPEISRVLRPGGRLCVLYMAWLPEEDKIAGESEALVLQYNPDWSGKGSAAIRLLLSLRQALTLNRSIPRCSTSRYPSHGKAGTGA